MKRLPSMNFERNRCALSWYQWQKTSDSKKQQDHKGQERPGKGPDHDTWCLFRYLCLLKSVADILIQESLNFDFFDFITPEWSAIAFAHYTN